MSFNHDRCNQWLATHDGVITIGKLEEFGASAGAIQGWVRRGQYRRLFRGVLVSASWPDLPSQRLIGICLQHPSAVVGFTTAGQWWDFRRMADPLAHILIPHASSIELPGVIIHRTRALDRQDIVHLSNGMRVTSPVRTLFDSADMLGVEGTEHVLDQALGERRFTLKTLIRLVERLGHPRRPGAMTIRTVLHVRPEWRKALESELERMFRSALLAAGVPEPDAQHSIVLPGGHHIRIDLAWPEWKVALEIDHIHWHEGRIRSTADKARDRRLAAAGWTPARVTQEDIWFSLAQTVAEVKAILDLAIQRATSA